MDDGSWDSETGVESCGVNGGNFVTWGVNTYGFIVSEVETSCGGLYWEFKTWNAGIEGFWNVVICGGKYGKGAELLE